MRKLSLLLSLVFIAFNATLESQPIPGCRADYLGRIDYVCVASPEFYQRYFSSWFSGNFIHPTSLAKTINGHRK